MLDLCTKCVDCRTSKKMSEGRKVLPKWRRWTRRKRNAENYAERVIYVGQKKSVDQTIQDDEWQTQFVGNAIKSYKYTALTFLPRNLFEQFRRIANVYFAIIGFIQLLIDSPVSPFTSITPLAFVIVVTMVKQGYEDFLRHRADNLINKKQVTRVENDGIEQIQSQNVQVGDILCVEDEDELPCDLLLLSTSNANGKASVLTANLDGETNLKVFSAPIATRHLRRPHDLQHLQAVVECESPNPDLGRFVGRLKVTEPDGLVSVYPLGPDNIVWRGTRLKNTDFVYGCAIYTGCDTKMSLNSKLKSNKFSSIEVMLNKYLLCYLILLIIEVVVSTVLRFSNSIDRPGSQEDGVLPWYMGTDVTNSFLQVAQDSLSFLVLYNYIIPISLYVTLELQKFFGSLFLTWDLDLYDEATDQPAKCNTSDLNEELGNVEFLFSDKTGTLTENIMIFRECSIDAQLFADQNGNLVTSAESTVRLQRSVKRFLEVLSLCHTVQAVQRVSADGNPSTGNPYDLVYHASSPDEKAIVEACRNYGVAFLGERENENGVVQYRLIISLSSKTKKINFERLHVLEFDSNRKCMSVVIRDSKGRIRLLTKGAESSILPKCNGERTSSQFKNKVASHVDTFASRGLRTLAIATRTLSDREYSEFAKRLNRAEKALDRREEKLRQVYESVETNLELIGAIGIEDRLQEGVKETLVSLGKAGIKVWILTGDKKETAINISQSCGHYRPNMQLLDLAGLSNVAVVERVLDENLEKRKANPLKPTCVVIDGITVSTLFSEKQLSLTFRELSHFCDSVICCRMSPLQKAEIVRLIKESGCVTAAIGDGANDVSMIQEAHVGLGIAGLEGRAAVRASDFAFSKFRHLKKVLLVHGHWYYYRAAILVQYFFYKNVASFTGQFFFAFFNSFSSQTLYDGVNLTLFNITFTSLPIFVFGLFEQNVKADVLLKNPSLYKNIRQNRLLSLGQGLIWFVEALWHAVVVFFAFYCIWTFNLHSVPDTNNTMEMYSFGLAIYQCVLVVVSCRIFVQSRFWNWILIFAISASLLFFLGFTLLYHGVLVAPSIASFFYDQPLQLPIANVTKLPLSLDLYWVIYYLLKSPVVWLATLAATVLCLLPYFIVQGICNSQLGDILRGLSIKNFQRRKKLSTDISKEFDNYGFDDDDSIVNIRL